MSAYFTSYSLYFLLHVSIFPISVSSYVYFLLPRRGSGQIKIRTGINEIDESEINYGIIGQKRAENRR